VYSRVLSAVLQGSAAGILGLTSVYGIVFYLITSAVLLVLSATVIQYKVTLYFSTQSSWLLQGIFPSLMV
jgi:hypothetical protein